MLKLLNSLAKLQLVISAESELDFKDVPSLTNSMALGKFLSFSIVSLTHCKMGINEWHKMSHGTHQCLAPSKREITLLTALKSGWV